MFTLPRLCAHIFTGNVSFLHSSSSTMAVPLKRTYVKTADERFGVLMGAGDGDVAVALFDTSESWAAVPTEQYCISCVRSVPTTPGGFVSTECPFCQKIEPVRQMVVAQNPITVPHTSVQIVKALRWAVVDSGDGFPRELWRLDVYQPEYLRESRGPKAKLLFLLEFSSSTCVDKDGVVHEFFLARNVGWNERGHLCYESFSADSCIDAAAGAAIAAFPKALQITHP